MFSRSLFKQSCKANGTMWAIITFAVCFMLTCVMVIAGGSDISTAKNAIQNTIIEGELTSQIEGRGLNYYNLGNNGLINFDDSMIKNVKTTSESEEAQNVFKETYQKVFVETNDQNLATQEATKAMGEFVSKKSYTLSLLDFNKYIINLNNELGNFPGSFQYDEVQQVLMGILNPTLDGVNHIADDVYLEHDEIAPRYDLAGIIPPKDLNEEQLKEFKNQRRLYREDYSAKNAAILLSASMIKDENITLILQTLKKYGVTIQDYKDFGFADYDNVKTISETALVNYRANLAYRLEHMKPGETPEQIAEELLKETSGSLLASLPKEVSKALDEIGQSDLYGILVGSIFFKMAGLLLPIIFMIMASNNLIAGQVDSGSMAYILSSSVKRRTVVITQAIYLVTSLFTMFSCTTVTSLICLACLNVQTSLTYGKLCLINLGAFITMFAMSGICFLASCWFNRAKRAMAIGGGLNMFFLVATMLGLFGSSILPSIIRMEALNSFNYVSIISLFDVISILDGGLAFLWKFAILIGIGVVCYAIGSEKFVKKDLPL